MLQMRFPVFYDPIENRPKQFIFSYFIIKVPDDFRNIFPVGNILFYQSIKFKTENKILNPMLNNSILKTIFGFC